MPDLRRNSHCAPIEPGSPRSTILALVLVLVAGCAATLSDDSVLANQLVGKWSEVRLAGQCNCERYQQSVELMEDRTFRVVGVRRDATGPDKYSYDGDWKVEGGFLVYRIRSSEPKGFRASGSVYRDRIVSVSDAEWVKIEQGTENELRAWRYPK